MKKTPLFFISLCLAAGLTSCNNNAQANPASGGLNTPPIQYDVPYGFYNDSYVYETQFMFKKDGYIYNYDSTSQEYVEGASYIIAGSIVFVETNEINSPSIYGYSRIKYYFYKPGCLLAEYERNTQNATPQSRLYFVVTEEFANNIPAEEVDYYYHTY